MTDHPHGPRVTCSHFRRARPPSQLLKAAFDDDLAAAEVATALGKVIDAEQKLRETEADFKSKEGTADRDLWLARPLMSDYCGAHEAEQIHRIAEVANRGLGCDEFAAGRPERRSCADCGHRRSPTGRDRDAALESIFATLSRDAIALQGSPQSSDAMTQAHRSGQPARKALEIAAVYAGNGRLMSAPDYLDHCAAFSTEDDVVVCAFANPHATCSHWKGPAGTPKGRNQS